jgi:RHS repeat-associated protein
VVHEYQYSVFGKIVEESGDSVENPFTYTSREYDKETGNYFYRARYYHPQIGRFISEDPLQFESDDVNFYSYVINSPLSWVDPLGLKVMPVYLPGKGETFLDDSFWPLVQQFMDYNEQSGLDVTFSSAFRTTKAQGNLRYNPNATTPARAGTSLHEAGFAVDINWSKLSAADQETATQNAKNAGLGWGGDFKKYDPVHFYHEVPGGKKNRSSFIERAQKEYKKQDPCK